VGAKRRARFTIQPVLDEGTGEPFIARLMAGAFEMRDQVVLQGLAAPNPEREARRLAFDALCEPMLNDVLAMRNAAGALDTLVAAHRDKVESGAILGRQPNAIEIRESIDYPLGDQLARFLNSSVRAAKSSLQNLTKHLGLDIGGFFVKDSNFEARMTALEAQGHGPLVKYFRIVRAGWIGRLVNRRNLAEHEGWALDRIQYPPVSEDRVRMVEPEIDGIPVSRWVTQQNRHVLAFIENVLVYSFQILLKGGVGAIVEIPRPDRDPSFPRRFRLALNVEPWMPYYEPDGFQ
jgi:hypothetical protein